MFFFCFLSSLISSPSELFLPGFSISPGFSFVIGIEDSETSRMCVGGRVCVRVRPCESQVKSCAVV